MWPSPVHLVMAYVRKSYLCIFGILLVSVSYVWGDSAQPVRQLSQQTLTFAQEVQAAVKANDVSQLSLMISFPLQVNLPSGRSIRMTRSHFHRYFFQVFTPQVKTAVETQNLNTLLETGYGGMYGVGDIWFSSVCADISCSHSVLKIRVVNVF